MGTRAAQAHRATIVGEVSVRAHGASATPDRHGQHGRKHNGRLRTQVGQRSQIRIKKLIHEIEIAFSGRGFIYWSSLVSAGVVSWNFDGGMVVANISKKNLTECTRIDFEEGVATHV